MTEQQLPGKPSSLTSIAFNTGVVMERQRIAAAILRMSRNWKRPVSHNPQKLLDDLAKAIEMGELQ